MARRMLAWLLVTPLAAAGVLVAHAAAYRLTGTPTGSLHAYLDHVPQVVAVLATIGLVGLALQQRSVGSRSIRAFALAAPAAFVCQEHVERLLHTGELPWLLTTPSFLVGLALQVPVAVLCVLVARRVVGTLAAVRPLRRPPALGTALLPLTEAPASPLRTTRPARATGRSPPALLAT
jgi:hypothetical protein